MLFFLLGGGSTIIAANLDHGPKEDVLLVALFGWIALFFLWFVIVIICNLTSIRPTEITDEEISLAGVAPAFADALADDEDERRRLRLERRRGRTRWRDDFDD